MRALSSRGFAIVTAFVSYATAVNVVAPPSLNLDQTSSIQGVAKVLADGALSYYPGNATVFTELATPYYWWECGALLGALLDYSHYTNDSSYDELLTTGLAAQLEPPYNLIVEKHRGDEGNDDQAFWGFTVLSAAERNFAQVADTSIPSWLKVAENTFNSMISRWNTSACGGGLLWQIYAENPNGLSYRNSVSNGGLFQISARLYRATGNATYLHWANKVWDWSIAINMVGANYVVYDGADSSDNCTVMNPVSFSYAAGIYLYGAAVLANATEGSAVTVWVDRAEGLLRAAESFFTPFDNATNIMYEHACEQVDVCDTDMKSFKGYLSRYMYASARMLPALQATVSRLLDASAAAAARACSGGVSSSACGQKWYVGGFDGSMGLGQEMSALETVQGLLARQAPAPLAWGEISDVRLPAKEVTTTTSRKSTATRSITRSAITNGTTTTSSSSTVSSVSIATFVPTSAVVSFATTSPTSTKRSKSAGTAVRIPGGEKFWMALNAVLLTVVFTAAVGAV